MPGSQTDIHSAILKPALQLDRRRLWKRLRIDAANVRRTLAWWRLIDEYTQLAQCLMDPRGIFRFFGLEGTADGRVLLTDGLEITHLRQTRFFEQASRLALCAVSLGNRLEERCNDLAVAGDYPEASLLSLIGDCALAEAQTKILDIAETALSDAGCKRGVVLQPGARYWDIQGNGIFSRALRLDDAGIQVLESFALRPYKSKTCVCVFFDGGWTQPGTRA